MKKILSYLTVVSLLLFSGGRALAQSVTIDGIAYTLEQGEVAASVADSTIVAADILSSVAIQGTDYPVTRIADFAFSGCGTLTSVVIPEGVTTIGNSAFVSCIQLSSVTLPEGLITIGTSAFSGCSSLTSLVLPEGLTTIGEMAFAGCSSLASVTLPSTVRTILRLAFSGCPSLTTVTIPEGVTTIAYGLFSGCPGLTTVTLPESVTTIEELAFNNCASLTSVALPASITSIGSRAFAGCSSLASFISYAEQLPASVHHIFGDPDIIKGCTLYVYSKYQENYADWASLFAQTQVLTALVTYVVDGEEYATREYVCGDTLTLIDGPTKEGYHFSGWSQAPLLMPLEPLTVKGTFIPNIYTVTYLVRGEIYCVDSVAYGSVITPPAPPVDPVDGVQVFSGWIDLPETMPAHDIIVVGDGYRLTYKVDGVIYSDTIYSYGSPITPLPEPAPRVGYTFSGWSRIPTTMPENDVVVTGSFIINTYTVTYKVDDKVVHTDTVAYGTPLTPLAEPVEEGRTFSGWSEIPATMPTHDVVVTGSFSTDIYCITYVVDGQVHHTDSVVYGMGVIPAEEPTKEGHTFSGWSEIPRTMPSHDVTVTGSFTINTYLITYIVDGETYHTDSITYGAIVVPIEQPVKEGYILTGWDNIPVTMPAEDVAIIGLFILADRHTDEQGLVYELNAAKDAFEVSGYTDDLVRDVVIPTTFYGLPVNAIQPRALAFTIDMQSLVIPATVLSVGENSLGGNETLLTIEWGSPAPVDAECFSRPSNYGNMLVYVSDATTEVTFQGNVVIEGVIDQLTLLDGAPFRNIHEFTARTISYTRSFDKKSAIGISSGWEGVVIPFDVQRVESKERGELKPFGEADFDTSLPYWLGQLQPDGTFAAAQHIVANQPFIMQVPNSDEYEERYNVAGDVTFSAENATVHTTVDVEQAQGEGYTLLGSYEGTPVSSRVYALNDEEYTADGAVYLLGGIFVANSRDIRPFEAYIYNANAVRAPYLRIGEENATGIAMPTANSQQLTAVYDLTGRRVDNPEAGIYIVNGKKLMVK